MKLSAQAERLEQALPTRLAPLQARRQLPLPEQVGNPSAWVNALPAAAYRVAYLWDEVDASLVDAAFGVAGARNSNADIDRQVAGAFPCGRAASAQVKQASDRPRRLSKDYDRRPDVSAAWVWLAETRILLRRLTEPEAA